MADLIKKQEGVLKKLSRRSWLRNAAIRATSVVMLLLVLNSCTKDQWDDVTGKVPGGGLGSTPDTWYNLKVTYRDKDGKISEGFLGRIDRKQSTAYWEYMKIGDKSKFKVQQAKTDLTIGNSKTVYG